MRIDYKKLLEDLIFLILGTHIKRTQSEQLPQSLFGKSMT